MQPTTAPLLVNPPGVKVQPRSAGTLFGFLRLREHFSLDLRSLAALRIGLGVILFIDWIDRLPDLRAHYSDSGIVPRDVITGLHPFSVLMFHGSAWFAGLVAGIALLFSVLLIVGWRTPFVTLISWFLLLAAHTRCPPVMQGGDQLLRMLLFWGIFLPLGARYSVDSSRPGTEPRATDHPRQQVLSPASVAYIVQMCLVYWYASSWKWAPEWRTDGTAIYLALKAEYFTTRFAQFMLGHPEVLRYMTFSVLWLEALGPVVLFFPFAPGLQRMLVISAFICFHVGLAISMELSNFPWVCCIAWLALLPPSFWNRLDAQLRSPEADGLTLYYDADRPGTGTLVAWLRTFLLLGESRLVPAQEAPDRLGRMRHDGGWAVVDAGGNEYQGVHALEFLVRLSPLGGSLAAGLFRFRFVRWLAERLLRGFTNLPHPQRRGNQEHEARAWVPPGGWIGNTVVIFCIIYVALWNIRSYGIGHADWFGSPEKVVEDKYRWLFPPQAGQFGIVMGLEQGWGLFAPKPGTDVGWHLVIGTRKDGTEIELLLLDGAPVDRNDLASTKPKLLAATYPNGRWRKLVMNLPATAAYPYLPSGFARYYFNEWNATHSGDEQVTAVEVIYMAEESKPPGVAPPPPRSFMLFHYAPDEQRPQRRNEPGR
jgi:hypothetical protein